MCTILYDFVRFPARWVVWGRGEWVCFVAARGEKRGGGGEEEGKRLCRTRQKSLITVPAGLLFTHFAMTFTRSATVFANFYSIFKDRARGRTCIMGCGGEGI